MPRYSISRGKFGSDSSDVNLIFSCITTMLYIKKNEKYWYSMGGKRKTVEGIRTGDSNGVFLMAPVILVIP